MSNKFKAFIVKKTAGRALEAVKKAPLPNQLTFLQGALDKGLVTDDAVKTAIMNEAPKNMHKGARKLRDEGKEITVETLLRNGDDSYYDQPDFQKLAERVGLGEEYFKNLARQEVARWSQDNNYGREI